MGTESVSDILYHYTTVDGLIGIISKQAFWLSDYRSLNDRSEIEYAIELVKEVAGNLDEQNASLLREIDYIGVLESGVNDPVLIGSFSASNENPVLWRLYSRGYGFVLGIEKEALVRASKHLQNSKFGEVLYTKNQQREFIRKKLQDFLKENVIGSDPRASGLDRKFKKINFFFFLHELAPFVKSDAFEHEAEWRISAHVRNCHGLNFRSRAEDIVPYIEMGMAVSEANGSEQNKSWLRTIDMGARVDVKRVMPQIYSLLRKGGVNPEQVSFYQNKFPI